VQLTVPCTTSIGAGYAALGLGLVSDAASIVTAPTASSLAWFRARARDMPGLPFVRHTNTSEQTTTLPEASPSSCDQPSTSAACDESSGGDDDQPGIDTAGQQDGAEGDGGGKLDTYRQGTLAEERGGGVGDRRSPDGKAAGSDDAAGRLEELDEPGDNGKNANSPGV
jgi:hypothetical protein